MTGRLLAWLGAGLLTAGLSTATIAGAAVAVADDDSGGATAASSQSSESTDGGTDATDGGGVGAGASDEGSDARGEADDEDVDKQDDEGEVIADDEAADDEIIAEEGAAEEIATEEIATEEIATEEAEEDLVIEGEAADDSVGADNSDSANGAGPIDEDITPGPEPETAQESADSQAVVDQSEDAAPATAEYASEETTGDSAAGVRGDRVTPAPTASEATPAATEVSTAMGSGPTAGATTVMMTTARDAAPVARPSLLNVVGSIAWGLLDLATRLLDAPPTVPPGSTLTAGRSRLEIDCGDGYTTTADWYFPTEGEPETFIYFQHGFAARAGFFNLTLQALAERNNAIVVAPSITSNIFACDACSINGEPMQAAAARLFEGDRAALVASAAAAGYDGALPEKFVVTGQSAGAHLAAGLAGYYHQFAPDDDKSNLVGAILYDISGINNDLPDALDRVPDSFPLLLIAAEPNMLTSYGSANEVFLDKRPGQFNGIQLVGGAHSDAFRTDTLFGITQLIVDVFFGASSPENQEAVHVLTQGWITDMYAGRVYDPATRTGIYGEPGEPGEVVVDIPTDAGLARGYILPAPVVATPLFGHLTNLIFKLTDVDLYARCAVDPEEVVPAGASIGPVCSQAERRR